jgi:hypothetical protein
MVKQVGLNIAKLLKKKPLRQPLRLQPGWNMNPWPLAKGASTRIVAGATTRLPTQHAASGAGCMLLKLR